ncbi:hypothetical protein YC2023_113393 [Brassica napus]
MAGTRLPDERAQAVRSLGSLLNYVWLDPRKGYNPGPRGKLGFPDFPPITKIDSLLRRFIICRPEEDKCQVSEDKCQVSKDKHRDQRKIEYFHGAIKYTKGRKGKGKPPKKEYIRGSKLKGRRDTQELLPRAKTLELLGNISGGRSGSFSGLFGNSCSVQIFEDSSFECRAAQTRQMSNYGWIPSHRFIDTIF